MDGVLKKGVGILVIVFLGFWMMQDPNGFADSAKNATSAIWDALVKFFDAFISFLKSISN